MKAILIIAGLFVTLSVSAQTKTTGKLDKSKPVETVEVSCGQCNFNLKTQKGCDLAIRKNGKAYFVDGTDINEHGDAHDEDGFCNVVKTAKVQGKLKGDRYKVTYMQILPPTPAKP